MVVFSCFKSAHLRQELFEVLAEGNVHFQSKEKDMNEEKIMTGIN